jgi:hypothetical protein
MTEYSIPQQGLLVGDATRAPYDADEWSIDYSAKLNGYGSRADYGPLYGYDNGTNFGLEVTQVTIASSNVELKVGSALVKGTIYVNDATLTLAIAANASGNARIDTVVLRKDYAAQTVRAAVRQGTPAASPVPPTMTQVANTTWEIPIADIAVANGFSTIVNSNITPRHLWANASHALFVDGVLNNSGGTLETGDVVIWDASKSVTTTTTRSNRMVAGVWQGRTAAAGRGRVMTMGLTPIKAVGGSTEAIAFGSPLVTSTTAKRATLLDSQAALNPAAIFALAFEALATATNGTILGYVNVLNISVPNERAILYESAASAATPGGLTSGSWQKRSMDSFALNQLTGISISSGEIVLPAGAYLVKARAPAFKVGNHSCRIFNVTAGTLISPDGSVAVASAADNDMSYSFVQCQFFSAAAVTIRLETQVQTTNGTDGKGVAAQAWQSTSPYSVVEIERGLRNS